MTALDVAFANLYFGAAAAADPAAVPLAWRPLIEQRAAAEQSVRQSFESTPELAVDHHLQAVGNLVASWTINSARDLAWRNSLLLWELRDIPVARDLFLDSLAAATAAASRMLLVAV